MIVFQYTWSGSLLNNMNVDIHVHNLVGLSDCNEDSVVFSLSGMLVMALSVQNFVFKL